MQKNKLFVSIVLVAILSGCATTGKNPSDPWENWNRDVQTFNDTLDHHVLKPVAKGYQWVMPEFAAKGVSNFFKNINDISVVVNDLLQGKFQQTGEDGARFLLNSSIGIGGLFDVAAEFNLVKHQVDFEQTLGFWGVPTGPYLVLPIFGPSTPRGVGGIVATSALNPVNYFTGPFVPWGLGTVNIVDTRANKLVLEKIASEAALDRYSFLRDTYLTQRNANFNKGEDFDIDKALDENMKEEKH